MRHNGVHFFNISTAKCGPKLVCFAHFALEMCFAPQRRALFQHLNFQKWSDAEVFCTFSHKLRNGDQLVGRLICRDFWASQKVLFEQKVSREKVKK
jgi:hypothetical protein